MRGIGANDPDWSIFRDGIRAYEFSATIMKELWFAYHVDHDFALDTDIYFHAHWAVTGTNAGAVRWGFEYTTCKGHGQQAFPATQTVYVAQAANGTAYQHMIAETSAVTLAGLEPDSLILCRVFRDAADGADTQTGKSFLLVADVHYQVERFASKNRTPDFYT